jgi:3D (Asp-Asp-Asp) domain-containing protein
VLIITLNPVPVQQCQPIQAAGFVSTAATKNTTLTTVATAYNLKGKTTSGPRTTEIHGSNGYGCIALSRKLAKDLGLKRPGRLNYKFGTIIEIQGYGRFVFADLMPAQWRGYRVDIYRPTLRECKVFGVKKCQVRVVKPLQ